MPLDKAMELIGHHDQMSIKKYCRLLVEVIDRMMQRCLIRDCIDCNYCSVLSEEKTQFEKHRWCFFLLLYFLYLVIFCLIICVIIFNLR